ncbi:MAG: CPBP family intramembrane glutamic endopeptidase [Hyphomicrobiaceae bacterium]
MGINRNSMSTHQEDKRPANPSRSEDLRCAAEAGFAVTVTILAAMWLTTLAMVALVPRDLMTSGPVGGPDNIVSWLTLALFQIIATLLMLAFVARRYRGRVSYTLALGQPRISLQRLVLTIVVVVIVIGTASWISLTFFRDDVLRDLDVFKRLLADTPIVLPILVLCIGAPISEEILFRGFLLGRLAHTRLGFLGAALIATVGWTALHWGYSEVGMVEVFIAGLLFSWALWRSRSLWVPIAFHGAYNGCVLAVIHSL